MTAQFEGERSSLEVLHAHDIEELQEKMETAFRENQETQSLIMVKDQAATSNAHLRQC